MKILEVNKKYLMLCWILTKDKTVKVKLLKLFINFLFVVGNLCVLGASNAVYIYRHPHDIPGAVKGTVMISGGITAVVSYIGFIRNEQRIWELYRELQSTIDNGKLARNRQKLGCKIFL